MSGLGNMIGVGLGAAATSGLDTYKTMANMESQRLLDQQRRQAIASGELDLAQKDRQAQALKSLDDVTKQFQYPGTTAPISDPLNAGDPTPGIDQSTTGLSSAKAGPDFSYLSDPVKFAQYQQAIAPHVMTALGPEKGSAFMQQAQHMVNNFIPQAAQRLLIGDTAGATKLLQASPAYGTDLKDVRPGVDADGKPTGAYTLDFAHKGAVSIDPQKIMAATLEPGKFLDYGLSNRKVGAEETTAAARTATAAADTSRAATTAAEAPATIGLKNAQATNLIATAAESPAKIGELESHAGYFRGMETRARAQADKAEAEAQNGPKRNWGQINNQIANEAIKNGYVQVPDPTNPGKTRADDGKVAEVRSRAERLARQYPDFADSPSDAVQAAVIQIGDVDRLVAPLVEKLSDAVSDGAPVVAMPGTKANYWKNLTVPGLDGKDIKVPATGLADFKTKATAALRQQALDSAGLDTARATLRTPAPTVPGRPGMPVGASGSWQRGAPTSSGAPAPPGKSGGGMPVVGSREEAAALPPGTRFQDKTTGQVYTRQ